MKNVKIFLFLLILTSSLLAIPRGAGGNIHHILKRSDIGKTLNYNIDGKTAYNHLFEIELQRDEEIIVKTTPYLDSGIQVLTKLYNQNDEKRAGLNDYLSSGETGTFKYKTIMGGKHHIEISSSSFNVGYFELKIESIGVNKKGKTQLKANTDTKTGNKLSNEKTLKELLKEEYFKGYQKGIKDCKNGAIDCKK